MRRSGLMTTRRMLLPRRVTRKMMRKTISQRKARISRTSSSSQRKNWNQETKEKHRTATLSTCVSKLRRRMRNQREDRIMATRVIAPSTHFSGLMMKTISQRREAFKWEEGDQQPNHHLLLASRWDTRDKDSESLASTILYLFFKQII